MINSLRCGHLIIVTGSKFYGGPPFSGALLVPQNLHPSQTGLHRFPSRFSDFLTAACLPDDWQGLRNSLPVAGNPGLAIRWLAALAEMRRYFAIPERTRLDIVTAFQRLVVSRLSTARSLQLRFVEPPPIHRTAAEHLENLMTVFPFSFHFPERIRDSIDGDTMEYLFHSLHQPLPAAGKYSREDDSNPCRARFHVGRPVKMGFQTPSANDALRIAIGAPLISEVSECHGSVSSYDQKLEWIDNKLSLFIQKLEYQAAHLDLRERQNLQTVAIRRAA